jgi:hypothetical protein
MNLRQYMQRCAAEYLKALLAKHRGCVPAAAAEAGVSRASMYRALHRSELLPSRSRVRGNVSWQALQ